MKAQAPLNSNWDFWMNLVNEPLFNKEVEEYVIKGKEQRMFKHHRVRPIFGKFMNGLHAHPEEKKDPEEAIYDLAETGDKIGYNSIWVTAHLATYKKFVDYFGGKPVLYFDGLKPVLVRGVECHCKDNGKEVKLLISGYRNPRVNEKCIEPGLSLEETINRAKTLNGLIMPTATLNEDAKGIDSERFMAYKDYFDAVGILDAACGIGGLRITRLYSPDIRAARLARELDKCGIYELNSHTLDTFGCVGVYADKKNVPCLANPQEVLDNPDTLTNQFRDTFRKGWGAVQNKGTYFPAIAPLLNLKMLGTMTDDVKDAQFRYADDFCKYVRKLIGRNGKNHS